MTNWIDWHPKPGDTKPEVYRYRTKREHKWHDGVQAGMRVPINCCEIEYQIPSTEETEMKYWHPRFEPVVNGWTLADVPDVVACEIKTNDSRLYTAWVNSATVYRMDEGGNENVLPYKPSDCRVIRVIDPIPAGQMTLDRVPEGVRCVCREGNANYIVRKRIGDYASSVEGIQFYRACDYTVLHILDPIPQQTYTLETLPVGRVIEQLASRFWKKCVVDNMSFWMRLTEDGQISEKSPYTPEEFTVTDWLMELKEATR